MFDRRWRRQTARTRIHNLFLDASPAQALDVAREAAGGLDVRIGGGSSSSARRPGVQRVPG